MVLLLLIYGAVVALFCYFHYFRRTQLPPPQNFDVLNNEFDFNVEFYCKKGWFGTFYNASALSYGIITDLPQSANLKRGDKLRVFVSELVDGSWQASAIRLELPEGCVKITYKDKQNRWHFMYPDERGFARAGEVLPSKESEDVHPGDVRKAIFFHRPDRCELA